MIDRATIERIKDTANIVEVVSEFVTLRKSGANYKGLCPFHNERTPSFMVSPARGTCHCFGCGKGGNAVTFIMEHEQMTYPEALRWLANKYHIEIKEKELTDQERQEQSERESMFIMNEWAAKHFERLLNEHPEGMSIGRAYFRQRGIRDDIVKKFRLGYDVNDRRVMANEAKASGFNLDFLLKTGLCFQTERGELIDRFSGRVVFPWTGVNGKVVGFNARVLDSRTKGVQQKYINSPESVIYHKDHELYGIFQAKRAIGKEDRVYVVEGQTDVIAMHQVGIENVVAGSGTALSEHQARTLRRFTNNITLLYDHDDAGIHAALTHIDMLLAEDMNVKVLFMPDGEDPDSFARKHTADQFRQYLSDHEMDAIRFKTDHLVLRETDPLKRSEGLNSVVRSISRVMNPILRDTYLRECAQRTGMAEPTLINVMNRFIIESGTNHTAPAASRTTPGLAPVAQTPPIAPSQNGMGWGQQAAGSAAVEHLLARHIVRYGERVVVDNVEDEEGNVVSLTVAQYVYYNLAADNLSFSYPPFGTLLEEAVAHSGEEGFQSERYFLHHEDVAISQLATDLTAERYHLSESLQINPNREMLLKETDHLLTDFRRAYVEQRLRQLKSALLTAQPDQQPALMAELLKFQKLRNVFAKQLGANIVL